MKNKYIRQLPLELQKEISIDLQQALTQTGLTKEEIKKLVEDAMDSRLCDLEDTINIKKYMDKM